MVGITENSPLGIHELESDLHFSKAYISKILFALKLPTWEKPLVMKIYSKNYYQQQILGQGNPRQRGVFVRLTVG